MGFNVDSLRELFTDLGSHSSECQSSPDQVCPQRIFVLQEDAPALLRDELARLDGSELLVFIIGDNMGLRPYQVNHLSEIFGATVVELGSTPLFTSHCISIVQHLVDERWP